MIRYYEYNQYRLRCDLFILKHKGRLRYLRSIFDTFTIVKRKRPKFLFVQNPSLLLACFAVCVLKPLFNAPVIVDRHSNFFLCSKTNRITLLELIFRFLSFISIRFANITIVTNNDLAHAIRISGGHPFVLTDKIPCLERGNGPAKKINGRTILLISSFGKDEPIESVWKAALQLNDVEFFVSGNSAKISRELRDSVPDNITLTGFLSDEMFVNLLFSVDAIMVLSDAEYTLLCGCYEAVAAEKPLLTSNKKVLRELFDGAVFVDNNSYSITTGVKIIFNDLERYARTSKRTKEIISSAWEKQFIELNKQLDMI